MAKIDGTRVKRNFLTGLGILGPVGLTIYVSVWIIEKFGGIFTDILDIIPGLKSIPYFFQLIISTALVLLLIYATGAYVGQSVKKAVDAFFSRVPIIRGLYNALSKFTDSFMESLTEPGKNKEKQKRVVMISFPHKGSYSLGFLTSKDPIEAGNKRYFKVFIPTTPNPTSGFLIFAEEKDIKFLNITSEEAIRIIVSGGVGQDMITLNKMGEALRDG